jgi:hypothetical protein
MVRGSSCTATPPDAIALADVAQWSAALQRSIRSSGDLPPADALHEQAAGRLVAHLGLDHTAIERVLLAPSGTDVESILTALALASNDRPLCNIVLGSAEAGSGTVAAAHGHYFAGRTPFRAVVTSRDAIDGLDIDRVRVVDVELRDHRGRPRRAFDVEAEVEAHIEDALDRGEQVLVHAMAGSKTDLLQLSPDWVRIWRARGAPNVRVVVDAAQARVQPTQLRDCLSAGASVLMTGSKALGAPPFCGAILLDSDFQHAVMDAVSRGEQLPAGLTAISARADFPRWMRGMLPSAQVANLGLLARWHVGLCELDRFRAIPSVWRADFSHRLLGEVTARLAAVPGIAVMESESPSIVAFGVRTADGELATRPTVRGLYNTLVAQPGVQFGQPVELAPGGPAVLRYAIGVVTTSRAALSSASAADAARDASIAAADAVRAALVDVHV